MMKDIEVMRVDFDLLTYEVIHEKYLPYPIRGRLKEIPRPENIKTAYDMTQSLVEIDKESIYKMWIVDFLISNRDRHGQNWGFFYNTETMEILGCHPLFDHNKAFDIEYMKNMDSPYQFGGMTIKQAAKKAMNEVDFHFTAPITREDFITERQYVSFRKRAEFLGLKIL